MKATTVVVMAVIFMASIFGVMVTVGVTRGTWPHFMQPAEKVAEQGGDTTTTTVAAGSVGGGYAADVDNLGTPVAEAPKDGVAGVSPKSNREANMVVLRQRAREAEAGVREGDDARLVEFATEYARDAVGYHFEARRWGDYIEISIRRVTGVRSLSVLLSQLAVGEVRPGHAADQQGVTGFEPTIKGKTAYGSSSIAGVIWSMGGDKWHGLGDMVFDPADLGVKPVGAALPSRREIAVVPTRQQCAIGSSQITSGSWCSSGTGNTLIGTWTTNVDEGMWSLGGGELGLLQVMGTARPAADDEVTFSPSGIKIYAPFGKGVEVLRAIETASGRDAATAGGEKQ